MSSKNGHDHRKIYWKVWLALVVLTAITVWTARHDFGTWNIVIAMGIASFKASLVALFFMHLKYDNKLDKVAFASSLIFLFIFVGLTASDMLDRTPAFPVKVAQAASGSDMGDVATLAKPTPELIAKGKTLYGTSCASCHGVDGKGDGPAAAAFNPKPRNFTVGDWKQGGKPTQLFNTISTGFGSMPSFAALSADDRWALVHYIRSLAPNSARPEDSAADITALSAKAASQKPRISVREAMDMIAVPPQEHFAFSKKPNALDTVGSQLYMTRCASCHGTMGEGGVRIRPIGSDPAVYLTTRNLTGSTAAWVGNLQEFIRINTEGLPGFGKPGIADLSNSEWQALHSYVRQLTGQ